MQAGQNFAKEIIFSADPRVGLAREEMWDSGLLHGIFLSYWSLAGSIFFTPLCTLFDRNVDPIRRTMSDQTRTSLDEAQQTVLGSPEMRNRTDTGTAFEREGHANKVGNKTGREYTVGISCEAPTSIVAPTAKPKLQGVDDELDAGTQMRLQILRVSLSLFFQACHF